MGDVDQRDQQDRLDELPAENRVIVSGWILSAPVCFFTSSRAAVIRGLGVVDRAADPFRQCRLVSRREAVSTVSLSSASIGHAPPARRRTCRWWSSNSWAMSDCSCSSDAPYSGVAEAAEQRLAPPSTVISLRRRSPWLIWWRCSTRARPTLVTTRPRLRRRAGCPRAGYGRTTSSRVRARRPPCWWWCSPRPGRRWRSSSARDARRRAEAMPGAGLAAAQVEPPPDLPQRPPLRWFGP